MALALDVRLDDRGGPYRGGDTVTGAVCVSAEEATDCRALSVHLRWHARHRRLPAARGTRGSTTIYEGELAVGEHEHRFEIELPEHAAPCDGEELTLRWSVEAQADVRFGIDPMARADLELAAPEPWGYRTRIPERGYGVERRGWRRAFLAGVALLLFGPAALVSVLMLATGDPLLLGAALSGLATFVGIVLVAKHAGSFAADRRFGRVRVRVRREAAGMEPFACEVLLPEGKSASEAMANLRVEEFLDSGGESHTKTQYRHVLLDQEPTALKRNGDGSFAGPVPLPEGPIPFTIYSERGGFRWFLCVRLRDDAGHEWTQDVRLVVWPDWTV